MGLFSSLRGSATTDSEPDQSAMLRGLVAEVAAHSANEEIFRERIAELELALDDVGWERVGGGNEDFQFGRAALDKLVRMSRLYYLKNPVIRRPVDIQAVYVWGQGYSVHAEGRIGEVIDGCMGDPSNVRTFFGHEARMENEKRLRIEGNLFLRFFVNPTNGRTQIRVMPLEEMQAVVRNPDDASEVWYYLRQFKRGKEEVNVLYPDWQYLRACEAANQDGSRDFEMPSYSVGEDEVRIEWDTPVLHKKTGHLAGMDFGVPEVYAAIDWARAYKENLEAHKKVITSLAKWAWKLKTGSGAAQLAAAQAALQTTFGETDDLFDSNPAPTSGSAFLYNQDLDLRAIDVSKATINPDEFRRYMLMAAAALGVSEVMMGDASAGTAATAKSMDRPTELTFRDRQTMWADLMTDVLTVAIEAAAEAPANKLVQSAGYDDRTGMMRLRSEGKEVDGHIDVDFPPILQVNVQEYLQSLTTFTTQNGQALQALNDGPTLYRIALTALGVDNVEEIVELFYPSDGSESKAQAIKTYEAPKTPEEVELEKAQQAKAMLAAQTAAYPAATAGSQPRAQARAGAAGGPNGKPKNLGGANATPPPRAQESLDEEAEARIAFMQSLMELQRSLTAKE